MPNPESSSSWRILPASSTPTLSPVPPTTAWPTATSAGTCTPSRARRSPKRAHGGSRSRGNAAGAGIGNGPGRPRQDPVNEVEAAPHLSAQLRLRGADLRHFGSPARRRDDAVVAVAVDDDVRGE